MAVAQPVARSDGADPQLLALKLPPHSVEAEQSLLGALLLDNQAFDKVADIVTGEDFYRALLQRHESPQMALADAQDEMGNDPRWRAPAYWAGFVMQGDWQ